MNKVATPLQHNWKLGALGTFLFVSTTIGLTYWSMLRGGPSAPGTAVQGSVVSVRVEMRKVSGAYNVCKIEMPNGDNFQSECAYPIGARVTVMQHGEPGAYWYRLPK